MVHGDQFSPADRGAVGKAIADVNRKLARDAASFYAASRRRLLLKSLQQLRDTAHSPSAEDSAPAVCGASAHVRDVDETLSHGGPAATPAAGRGGMCVRKPSTRQRKRARDDEEMEEDARDVAAGQAEEERMNLIGRCAELRERLAIIDQRRKRVCRLASVAQELKEKLNSLPTAGGCDAGAGGACTLRGALAAALSASDSLISQLEARMSPST